MKTRAIALASLNELQEIVETVEETDLEQMQELILNSNRIFVGAAGRSLLAMKFLAMRLMQIGLKVYLSVKFARQVSVKGIYCWSARVQEKRLG